MTSYHGGKQRIGKNIAEIIYDESIDIEDEYEFTIKGYCEPFCGMLGVYQHIPELFKDHRPKLKYKAGDVNKSVIAMWKAAKRGWKPPTKKYTKKMFEKLKYNGKSSAVKGFVGHIYTYRGVFFDGFFPHRSSKIKHSSANIQRIAKNLSDTSFRSGSYKYYSKLRNYIIYCDPPYSGTNQRYYEGIGYTNRLEFDNREFWDWCRMMAEHNIVFVSEFKAPRDAEKIYQVGKEKLFLLF